MYISTYVHFDTTVIFNIDGQFSNACNNIWQNPSTLDLFTESNPDKNVGW